MATPVISIVTPFYNAASFLQEAIESVLDQMFNDFEFLLLDDGSTDNSVNIIQSYRDDRIRLIRSEHHFIQTLNRGLELSQGKYIARMDADDVMLSIRLQEQFDFMEQHPEIDACGSWMQVFGEAHRRIECLTSHEEIVDYMILGNPMAHPAMILRKATLEKHHLRYNENYLYAEDFKLWLDIAQIGRLANIPKVLMLYRSSEEQISSRKQEEQEDVTRRIQNEAVDFFLKRINIPAIGNSIAIINEHLKELVIHASIPFGAYCQVMYEIAKGYRKSNKS
jgi:glycosyltransferase involved in cell wall biosynthesis